MNKPCEYCGTDLPLGVDRGTRRVRSFHFAGCEKRPFGTVESVDATPEPGWTVSHPQYGTWFISRAAVAADWKQDQKQAYPGQPEREPEDEEVDMWFNEQTTWIEVAARGKQIARPNMAAFEAAWLEKMKGDYDPAQPDGQ